MISPTDNNDHRKQLTPDDLADVRNAWGCGVSLKMLAAQRGLTEQELRWQLERRRQLDALQARYGGDANA